MTVKSRLLLRKKKSATAPVPAITRIKPTTIVGICDRRSTKEKEGIVNEESSKQGGMSMVIRRRRQQDKCVSLPQILQLHGCVIERDDGSGGKWGATKR